MCLATNCLIVEVGEYTAAEPSGFHMKLPRHRAQLGQFPSRCADNQRQPRPLPPQRPREGGPGVRRSHSANPRHSLRCSHQLRSQSYSPTMGMPSERMPIPPSSGGRDPEFRQNVGRSDLTRMYDHATWSMYERIVSARRKRMSQLDASGNQPSSSAATSRRSSPSSASGNATPDPKTSKSCTPSKPQALSNVRSYETSTTSTADESSASSSSWSRAASPSLSGPQGAPQPEQLASRKEGREGLCRQPRDDFIFEMDM